MSTAMPVLTGERLLIRPFTMDDLERVHQVLMGAWGIPAERERAERDEHERWLRWVVLNYAGLADLMQPPYGERAVSLKVGGEMVGVAGLVPALGPFGQLPGYPAYQGSRRFSPEVGLYWAVDPAHQGKGYATEAARLLIDYAFGPMNLGRIIATTEYDNQPSMGVMRKLGMRILRNELPEPPWFQAVGVLENPD